MIDLIPYKKMKDPCCKIFDHDHACIDEDNCELIVKHESGICESYSDLMRWIISKKDPGMHRWKSKKQEEFKIENERRYDRVG